MSRLTVAGVLNDYSVGQQERMAFDHGLSLRTNHAPRTVTVDNALKAARAQRAAADQAREQSPLAKAIPGLYRLP